jgi:hypothetical protein
VGIYFCRELCRNYPNTITFDFSMVKTHPKMLAALAALKTGVVDHH